MKFSSFLFFVYLPFILQVIFDKNKRLEERIDEWGRESNEIKIERKYLKIGRKELKLRYNTVI